MTCSQLVSNLFMTCLRLVHNYCQAQPEPKSSLAELAIKLHSNHRLQQQQQCNRGSKNRQNTNHRHFLKFLGLVRFDPPNPPILNPKGHLTLPIMKGGPKILFQSQPYFLDQNFLEQNLLNKFFSRQKIFFTTFFYQPFCLTYKILGVTFLDQFLLDKIFFEQHFVYQTFSDQLFLRPTNILKKLC